MHLLAVIIEPYFPEPLEFKSSRTWNKASWKNHGMQSLWLSRLCNVSGFPVCSVKGHLLTHQLVDCSQPVVIKDAWQARASCV